MPQKLNDNILKWFKKNIELQLEDVELERAGNKVVLYFDTSDIQTAVMGLQAFYRDGEFQKKRFERKKTLVDTLTGVGWLGEFNLLPPHLSEFYGKAEKNFNLKPTHNWGKEIEKFISDLRLLDGKSTFRNLQDKSEEELQREFSQRTGEEGVSWFKAIYSMTPWHRKLGAWLSTDLLNFDNRKFDYKKTVTSPNFGELKKTFDEIRKPETINNIVDAAALTYLIDLVEAFNLGETKQVPRFFLPTEGNNLWRKVLEQLNWNHKFVCNSRSFHGEPSWVFREEDYFLYKISFRSNVSAGSDSSLTAENSRDLLNKEYEALKSWSRQVNEVMGTLPDNPDEFNQTLTETHINQELVDLITSLQNYSVLSKDWFDNAFAKAYKKILKEYEESELIVNEQQAIYENQSFKAFIADQLKGKKEELVEELKDFRLASQLYDALYNSVADLRRRISNYTDLSDEGFFPFLGLLRYGFPEQTQRHIVEILNKLRSGEADNIQSGCAEVIKFYVDGRKNPTEKANDLMIAAGVLLAVGNGGLLEKLFSNIEAHMNIEANMPHFSLRVAYTEFLFRREKSKANHQKALKLMDGLEKQWKDPETSEEDKANLAVGLAYLYYWAWHAGGGVETWKLMLRKQQLRPDLFLSFYIDTAIHYADYAYLHLTDDQIEKKIYALNQYLFISIEGGNAELFSKLEERVDELQNQKGTKSWQFRFDDTLARYYFRKALLPDSENIKKELITWAKDSADAAKSKSDGDIEVDKFHDKIKQVFLELFKL